MLNKQLYTSLSLSLILLLGCSDDKVQNNTNLDTNKSKPTIKTVTGILVDSAVEGVSYVCDSGLKGLTNNKGEFTCKLGDSVEFQLANYKFPKVKVQKFITPKVLFDGDDEAALNFAQFLQTIDKDNDPSNGISIKRDILDKLKNTTIDFKSPSFDEDMQVSLGNDVVLVSEDDALEHLKKTYEFLGIKPNGETKDDNSDTDNNTSDENGGSTNTDNNTSDENGGSTDTDNNTSNNQDITSPTFTSPNTFSIYENQKDVGQILTDDTNATLSLSGDDPDAFELSSDGVLSLKNNADFETLKKYNIKIIAKDSSNNTSEQLISVNILDIDEQAPTFTSDSSFSINENALDVATITTNDKDATLSLSGDDANLFTLENSVLSFKNAPDYESDKHSYSVSISARDKLNNTSTQEISITLLDVDESIPDTSAPTITSSNSFSIDENKKDIASITTDEVATLTLSGDDASFFELNAKKLSFVNAPDFELDQHTYNITISAKDSSNNESSQDISIEILDVDEIAPSFTSKNSFNIYENQKTIDYIQTDDTGATLSISGDDASLFELNNALLSFKLTPDYENDKHNYNITLIAKDALNNSSSQDISIKLLDIDEVAPNFTMPNTFNISENETRVTQISLDDVNASIVILGDDKDKFYINNSLLSLINKSDYETQTTYHITLVAKDKANNSSSLDITINVADVDENAPVFTSASSFNINENSTTIGSITTNDSSATLSLVGANSSLFNLNANLLSFKVAPDYENEQQRLYSVDVRASDVLGNSSTQHIFITILDVDESVPDTTPPSFTNPNIFNVEENQVNIGNIITDETATFSLGGTDANFVELSNSTLSFKNMPDYETKTTYSFSVSAKDDANNTATQNITVNLIDVDDTAPQFTSASSFSIEENKKTIASITLDEDVVLSLSGDDASLFTLAGNKLEFKSAKDYENDTHVYNVTINAQDNASNQATQNITVTLLDVADILPSITSTTISINENTTPLTLLTNVMIDNGDSAISSINLVGDGSDNFTLSSDGKLKTSSSANIDYESKSQYILEANAINSAGQGVSSTITINITDLDEIAPSFTNTSYNLHIAENTTNVLTITSDESVSYELLSGDISNIELIGDLLKFKVAPDFEQDTKNYTLSVKATDSASNTKTQVINITVDDQNDNEPSFTSQASVSVDENQLSALTLSANDADSSDTLTYSVDGVDKNLFDFDANTHKLTFKNAPDYESGKTTYNLVATVDDGVHQVNQNIIINILNINDTSENLSFTSPSVVSVNENETIALDVNGNDTNSATLTYSLSGVDSDKLSIDSSTGIISFNTPADYESKTQYSAKATIDDGASHTLDQAITININDLNDNVPIFIGSYTPSVDENQVNVLNINVQDADVADTITYSIKPILDGASFKLVGDKVEFISPADYETKASYNFVLAANDGLHESTQTVVVSLRNIAENVPTLANIAVQTVDEDAPHSFYIAQITLSDQGDTSVDSYEISGSGSSNFTIDSDGKLYTSSSSNLDYESTTSYSLNVRAHNDAGYSGSKTLSININNVIDQKATLDTLSANVAENSSSGTSVGSINILNSGDSPINSITLSGAGSENFSVATNGDITVTSGVTLDYESTSQYTLSAYATNTSGNSASVEVVIYISDVNDAPIATFDTFNVDEDTYYIGKLTAQDIDSSSLTYTIISQPTHGTIYDFNTTNGSFRYKASSNWDLSDSFSYSVSDGDLSSGSKNVNITLNPIYDEPNAQSKLYNYDEDRVGIHINLDTTFDRLGTNHKCYISNAYPEKITVNNSSNSCSNIYVILAHNYNGTIYLNYYAQDDKGTSGTAQLVIVVAAKNDSPSYVNFPAPIVIDEAQTLDFIIEGEDIDGDQLSLNVTQVGHYPPLELTSTRIDDTHFRIYQTIPNDLLDSIYLTTGELHYKFTLTDNIILVSVQNTLDIDINKVYDRDFKILNVVYDSNNTASLYDDRLHIYYNKGIDFSSVSSDVENEFKVSGSGDLNTYVEDYYNSNTFRHSIKLYGYNNSTKLVPGDSRLAFSNNVAIKTLNNLLPIEARDGNGVYTSIKETKAYLKTGQTIGARSGDDGYLEKGVAHSFSANTINGDRVVTDDATNLMWQDSSLSAKKFDYTYEVGETPHRCSDLNFAGHSDWRFPTAKEVLGLVNYGSSTYRYSIFTQRPDIEYSVEVTKRDKLYKNNVLLHYTSEVVGVDYSTGELKAVGTPYGTEAYTRCVREN